MDWNTQRHDVSQVLFPWTETLSVMMYHRLLSPWTGTLSVMMYHRFYPHGLEHSASLCFTGFIPLDWYIQGHDVSQVIIPLDWNTQCHDVSQVLSPWTGTLSGMMYHRVYPLGLVHSVS